MNISVWFPALACVALIVYLLLQRTSSTQDTSPDRLALLVGLSRAWGETDASLRRRAIAFSRWPFPQQVPEVAWWARLPALLWKRIRR